MVDRREVFEVADRILKAGERPTVRSVRARLRKGGSHGDVGPLLTAWRAERDWRPRAPLPGLPASLQERLGTFGDHVWQAARAEASAGLADEMAKAEDLKRAATADVAELGALLDERDRAAWKKDMRIRDLEAELLDLREERARLLLRLERIERLGVRTALRAKRAPLQGTRGV